jgi:hypothetical protein
MYVFRGGDARKNRGDFRFAQGICDARLNGPIRKKEGAAQAAPPIAPRSDQSNAKWFNPARPMGIALSSFLHEAGVAVVGSLGPQSSSRKAVLAPQHCALRVTMQGARNRPKIMCRGCANQSIRRGKREQRRTAARIYVRIGGRTNGRRISDRRDIPCLFTAACCG